MMDRSTFSHVHTGRKRICWSLAVQGFVFWLGCALIGEMWSPHHSEAVIQGWQFECLAASSHWERLWRCCFCLMALHAKVVHTCGLGSEEMPVLVKCKKTGSFSSIIGHPNVDELGSNLNHLVDFKIYCILSRFYIQNTPWSWCYGLNRVILKMAIDFETSRWYKLLLVEIGWIDNRELKSFGFRSPWTF